MSWRPKSNTITYSHEETIKLARARQGLDQVFCVSLFDVSSVSKALPKGYVRYDVCDMASAFYFPDNGSPAWSRSGNKLAFARNGDVWMAEWDDPGDKGRPGWEVGRLAAVASYDGATNRASHSTAATERLSWSPDEKMLAYALTRMHGSGIADLHVLTLDKRWAVKKDQLLDDHGISPCFSPDGKLIAYAQDLDGFNIYVISPDGKGKRLIIKDGSQPDW
jgi:Tol biopolymer transport system component